MVVSKTLSLPDGRTMAYASYGDEDGTPLLFHHGLPGSCVLGSVFDGVARGRGARVIAPTRPGYGVSDPTKTTLDTWATDCEALVDHLSLGSFTVVGFSGGGPFALAVAKRSERVNAVGLVGGIVPESDGGLLEALARVPLALGLALRSAKWMARVRGPEFVLSRLTTEAVSTETANTVHRDFLRALSCGPTGAVRESRLFADDWSLPIPEPDVPVSVWHGIEDENVPIEPVRAAYSDRDVRLTEFDTDHLATLLYTREAIVEFTKNHA